MNNNLNKNKFREKHFYFSVENPTNACVILKTPNEKIVIDPWFKDGIYDGTWHNFPRLSELEKFNSLKNVDYCLFSHLHKDHFCIETIKKFLDKNTKFLIPKVFGWQVIKNNLNENGFSNLYILECAKDVFKTNDFEITSIPPINLTGLEINTKNDLSIDSGFSLFCIKNNIKCIFLADNNLYSEERINENFELLKEADLISFAYSGFASDYPFSYNFTEEEMVQICSKLEKIRYTKQLNNLRMLKPKCVMPYSSEFVAVGSYSNNWRKIYKQIWTSDKNFVAKKYGKDLGVEGVALYPKDYLKFNQDGYREDYIKPYESDGDYGIHSMMNYAETIEKELIINEKINTFLSEDIDNLKEKIKRACLNYKLNINKHKLSPLQRIIITINKQKFVEISRNGEIIYNSETANSTPSLYLDVKKEMLERLLDGNLHWDDACLSMKLSWDRHPNMFCSDTMNALNYLKV